MAIGRGDDSDTIDETGADEDRLPWLEAVEEDDEGGGPSAAKLVAYVVIGLVAIGLVVGGLFWLGNRSGAGGEGELIAAPEGEYKVRPDEPGGMEVEGQGDTAHAASQGAQPQGQLDPNAVPEQPATQPGQAASQPQPAQPRQPAAASGPTIQLGAFSSQTAANRAWAGLSRRFTYLSGLSHNVVPTEAGGRTLYRLRASGGNSADICRRLRIAGEACTVVN